MQVRSRLRTATQASPVYRRYKGVRVEGFLRELWAQLHCARVWVYWGGGRLYMSGLQQKVSPLDENMLVGADGGAGKGTIQTL
jgi:hypothetical protein